MTALTFPSNPAVGDQYSAPNNVIYVFDGEKWTAQTLILVVADGGNSTSTF